MLKKLNEIGGKQLEQIPLLIELERRFRRDIPPRPVPTGPPPEPSAVRACPVGRGDTAEGASFAACGEARDLELVSTR